MGRRVTPFALLLALFAMPLYAQAPRPGVAATVNGPILKGNYADSSLPAPDALLGFEIGSQAATSAQIEKCFRAWQDSDRATLVQYATSHEGRPLSYMVITSPRNMARIDQIKADLARLSDPRSDDRAAPDPKEVPAVAWLAYSIHGDETSGADAALAVAYHLLASSDDETLRMLDELIIIIDPNMNPDGRERFLQMIREHRGGVPNIDDQALLHTGYWPAGRTNHYMFDLNRDWIYAVHPETQGRILAVRQWNPILFVDAHEMGPQDTFLFSPPRDPVNPNFPERRAHWSALFARDQATAFDANGWRYYTGEWNEGWYPGYSDAWAAHRGALGILYEQAGVAQDGVLQANKDVLTYHRAIRQQAASTMANLRTLLAHHPQMMEEFARERRDALATDRAPFGPRAWAIIPDENHSRTARFVDLMEIQGFEVRRAAAFRASGKDTLGHPVQDMPFPDGTLLIVNAQPEAHLISSMFEFDQRMGDEFLAEERREILRKGQSRLYDVTTWNIPMMFGLDAYELTAGFPTQADLYSPQPRTHAAPGHADVAWIIHGSDDDSVALAARLMEQGVDVRIATKDFTWGGQEFPRGSVLVTVDDNRDLAAEKLLQTLRADSAEMSLAAVPINTGLGEGDLPDLGGENFKLLERPRIAMIARQWVNPYDAGSIWHELDHNMNIAVSILDAEAVSSMDLRRYNTLIVPGSWGKSPVDELGDALGAWVEAGGTLIAIDSAAAAAASPDAGLGTVRVLSDALQDMKPYELALLRELAGRDPAITPDEVWSYEPAGVRYPWDVDEEFPALPDAEELKRRDEWQQAFMPQGAFLAARVDAEHWLTFGCRDTLPVLMGDNTVLMSAPPAEAPIRFGVYEDAATDSPTRAGWGIVPAGKSLRLRMSGLLWPEAAQRLANAAWVTRESVGHGQVILFASSPTFRGATPAMARVLRNAVVYAPGLGASHPITR